MAADVTARSATRPALVIAAHPADEVLGCGAVIARKRAAGTPVDVLIVTDGRHLAGSRVRTPRDLAARLREEAVAAAAMVGVDAGCVHLAGYEAGTLGRCEGALAAAIGKLLVELDPAEVFAPAPAELDDDRRAVRHALCRALVESGSSARLVSYGVDSWSDPPARARPMPGQVEAVRCERFRYLKQAALDAYASRRTNLTGELAWRALPARQVELLTSPTEVFLTSPRGIDQQVLSAVPGVDIVSGPGSARAGVDEHCTDADRIDVRGADRSLLEEVVDRFDTPTDHAWAASRGRVVGTAATSGAPRLGVDAERTISLHDSRLRFDPLHTPGWGRQGVAYGPFRRRPGLTFVARVLSSHHNAHTDPPPRGPRSVLEEVRKHGSPRPLLRPVLDDNLLVGFHDAAVPKDAAPAGSSFVLHAAGNVNGELRARVGGDSARLHVGVHEVPITYVVALRECGALYYVAGPPGAAT